MRLARMSCVPALALALAVAACGGGGTAGGDGDVVLPDPGAQDPGRRDEAGTDADGRDGAVPDGTTADPGGADDGLPDGILPDVPGTDLPPADVAATDAPAPDASLPDVPSTDLAGWDPGPPGPDEALLPVVLGRPTGTSIAASLRVPAGAEVFCEYGTAPGEYTGQTAAATGDGTYPAVVEFAGLKPDTRYFYRARGRFPGQSSERVGDEHTFQTARAAGRTFHFGLQGDSHPERLGKMFSPDLYDVNLRNAAARRPDFYIALGDDFSIERLLEDNTLTQPNVDAAYALQWDFFRRLAHSASLFLVNGNHEQVGGYLLTGNYPSAFVDAPILAGRARVSFFPLPATDAFYSADTTEVAGVGLLRDYYAFEWGDALFVTLDPYWHSPVPVDTGVPDVAKETDTWKITIGDEQYQWFQKTLEGSRAKWKFVFEHHVLGQGRGGAIEAGLFEWGGYDKNGKTRSFETKRPTWPKTMHQLMVDNGVTIYFFGHDHVFAREKVDTVIYQSVQNPADNTYTAFNADAYDPETIPFPGAAYDPTYGVVLPDSGFLDVTVGPDQVAVDYVRAVLPGDEAVAGAANGDVSFRYTVP